MTYATLQQPPSGARTIANRVARPGRDSRIAWCLAELGADLAASDVSVVDRRARGATHDLPRSSFRTARSTSTSSARSIIAAGEATSETLVKSAASERGQARFLGNIRIAPHAQGSDARLRDDALLLSKKAHVDSVPALEIGANDVKAFHGATVGAIDAEQIFYMESRGIERLGGRTHDRAGLFRARHRAFPASLRDEIRAALAAKLS